MMIETGDIHQVYQPISCAQHDVYEIAILRRQRLRLVWREGDISYDDVVVPVDLETYQGEEFLIARSPTRDALRIRLDHIRQASPV